MPVTSELGSSRGMQEPMDESTPIGEEGIDDRLHESICRLNEYSPVRGAATYTLDTADLGQVRTYSGDDPLATTPTRLGMLIGTHSRFGFGELRVRPASADRVPDRADAATGGEA